MIRYENNCCECQLFCNNCGRKHQAVLICDRCGFEVDDLYDLEGAQLCEDCVIASLPKVEIGE